MRWLKATGGLVVLVLLLTSCIKIEGDVRIEDDGSGTVDFLSALNVESLTAVLEEFEIPEGELGDTAELCDGFSEDTMSDVPAGAVVTPYEEDGFCGTRLQYDLPASFDHSLVIQELLEDETALLYKDGDNWIFETDFAADASDEITADSGDIPEGMADAFFGDASLKITIDLPGKAIAGANNATEAGNNGRFTWDIDILNPQGRLTAQTEPGSDGPEESGDGDGGTSPLLIALIVLALIGLAALAWWFMKQRSSGPDTTGGLDGVAPVSNMGGPDAMASNLPSGTATPDTMGHTGQDAVMPMDATTPVDSTKETVVVHQQDVQAAAAPASAAPQPVFDETLGAWTVVDPVRGRLRHDPATDTWNPI